LPECEVRASAGNGVKKKYGMDMINRMVGEWGLHGLTYGLEALLESDARLLKPVSFYGWRTARRVWHFKSF